LKLLLRYFNTLKFLKTKQVFYRILYFLTSPKLKTAGKSLKLRKVNFDSVSFLQKNQSLFKKNLFIFLNRSAILDETGWHPKDYDKLWIYNLHYCDWLNCKYTDNLSNKLDLLNQWIRENKDQNSISWEPYPTSLRIVNWIKWHLKGNELPRDFHKSLEIQTEFLYERIEWHILGNHLFANAKALLFSGLVFSGERSEKWLKKGKNIIFEEINEQVLDDGGNFERSPMYHLIFLEDVLDIINISKLYNDILGSDFSNLLEVKAKNMLTWIHSMIHPDKEISFFNDATLGAAAQPNSIFQYARKLGIDFDATERTQNVKYLKESGFIVINRDKLFSIIDVGKIGPDYLPGHAHAELLSFELSIIGHRFITNTGISEYKPGETRNYERGTSAHNTLSINNKNSSDVWSSFRVGKRASPSPPLIDSVDKLTSIKCSHNGFSKIFRRIIHERSWHFSEDKILIIDKLNRPKKNAKVYYHFHPSISIKRQNAKEWVLTLENIFVATFNIIQGDSEIIPSYYSIEFGKKLNSECIVVNQRNGTAEVEINWRILN